LTLRRDSQNRIREGWPIQAGFWLEWVATLKGKTAPEGALKQNRSEKHLNN
jgi:hypothetical protein